MKKIAIHSVPRSGSSWLGEILNSSPKVTYAFQPLFSYKLKSFLNENSDQEEINEFFLQLSTTDDDFITQKSHRDEGKKPVFVKDENINFTVYKEVRYHQIIRNLLEKDNEIKIIGLIRNPYSVINSWYNAPREFRRDLGWDLKSELIDAPSKNLNRAEEYFGLRCWAEVVILFKDLKEKYPDRFLIVDYELLCLDPVSKTREIYDFAGLDMTRQTYDFLEPKSIVDDTYSVFKRVDKKSLYQTNLDSDVTLMISEYLKDIGLYEFVRE